MRIFIDLLMSWGPMLLLVGVWIYFMRGGGQQGKNFEQCRLYMAEHLEETRRLNANLARIATILEANAGSGGTQGPAER